MVVRYAPPPHPPKNKNSNETQKRKHPTSYLVLTPPPHIRALCVMCRRNLSLLLTVPVFGPSFRTVNCIASSPQIHTIADPPAPPALPKPPFLPLPTLPNPPFLPPPAPWNPSSPPAPLFPIFPKLPFLPPPTLPKPPFLPLPALPNPPFLPPPAPWNLSFNPCPGLTVLPFIKPRGTREVAWPWPAPLLNGGCGFEPVPAKVVKFLELPLFLLPVLGLVAAAGCGGGWRGAGGCAALAGGD